MHKTLSRLFLAAGLSLSLSVPLSAWAQVQIQDPWIRGTVPQQKATGLFAQITSARGGKLVAGSSPVAGVVEIHEMAMDGNTMRMRALANGLELPAGQAVMLKPGGFHVMLMDLKRPLKTGEKVPVSLVIESAGQRETVEVQATVRALAAGNQGDSQGHGASHSHHSHQGHKMD